MASRGLSLACCLAGILCLSEGAALPLAAALESDLLLTNPNITFFMYPSLEAGDEPQTADVDALMPGQPLTMVFHGFKGNHFAKSVEAIKQALLLTAVQNVVVVDWGPLADSVNHSALGAYHHVRDHGVSAAAHTATQWLQHVMDHKNIAPEHVHLIGFSLGAHVAGIMGHMLNSSIGRITGLDPPKFGYELVPLSKRLDATDAMFVNVIHTSGGILGYSEGIGHVDFFPNGDSVPQLGCPKDDPIHIITCSHYFAFAVFVESVFNRDAMMGTHCASWHAFTKGQCNNSTRVPMGYYTPAKTRGMFFTKTKDHCPFGEEDPDHPIPESMIQLLSYNESDSIVSSHDVVNFLMHKERSTDEGSDDELSLDLNDAPADSDTKVMRVKNNRPSTTTPAPPPFLDSSASYTLPGSILLLSLAGMHVLTICSPAVRG